MRILDWVVRKLEKTLEKHNRFYVIHSNYEGEPTPYLVRYVLFRTRFLSIYIHRFLLPDDEVPHDHPFHFITYIVSGGYREQRWQQGRGRLAAHSKHILKWSKERLPDAIRKPGSFALRKKSDIHRVVLDRPYALEEKELAPLSICIIGPIKKNGWGFYPDKSFVLAGDFLDSVHTEANNVPAKWRD